MDHNSKREEEAYKPGIVSEKLHDYYRGKIQITAKCVVRDMNDFSYWYTPGVAEPCLSIARDRSRVYRYTNKGNSVAIVSDGTRVLGLGDIGPEAALPVMEGKALLFKYLGGVDAFPLCVSTENAAEMIRLVRQISPTYGGINLEDISQPKCFEILDELRRENSIPVWHDDQQGTALVTLAGLINALELVEKKLDQVKIVLLGAGAANLAIARLLISAGADSGRMILLDRQGTLGPFRDDLARSHPYKWKYCQITNRGGIKGDLEKALTGADVLIALSQPGPGVVQSSWISRMNSRSIVFACSNPTPEIWPWEAKDGGAEIVATGRSDFPNQVNNSLGFPAVFRGVLDVRARAISDEMCVAAAHSLAGYARNQGLRPDYILPRMDDPAVFPIEAATVACKAIQQGLAEYSHFSFRELQNQADRIIKLARDEIACLMENQFIPPAPSL